MTTALYVTFGALAGLAVLLLVSTELSKRLDISLSGRLFLTCFLGFGVFGLAIKAGILASLQEDRTLVAWAEAGRGEKAPAAHASTDLTRFGLTFPARGREWRALPAASGVENPVLVDLGRRLFSDPRLSADGTVACASCHDLAKGGDDGRATSRGVHGQVGSRNAPSVLNAPFLRRLFWDGRAKTLEEQATGPLLNPIEMGLSSGDQAVKVVLADPSYRSGFAQAGFPVNLNTITRAIAAFERSLAPGETAYDRFVGGDDTALSDRQLRGMVLFDEIGCRRCHPDPWFSAAAEPTASPYRIFPVFREAPLVQRFGLAEDGGRNGSHVWRVPSLRNVGLTAPYFHNGAVDRLEDAVRVMVQAQLNRKIEPDEGARIQVERKPGGGVRVLGRRYLTEADVADITAFLHALSEPGVF
ncbi:MAG: cytochrome-c peroxidase [Magnetovibrionaceae bacterium]